MFSTDTIRGLDVPRTQLDRGIHVHSIWIVPHLPAPREKLRSNEYKLLPPVASEVGMLVEQCPKGKHTCHPCYISFLSRSTSRVVNILKCLRLDNTILVKYMLPLFSHRVGALRSVQRVYQMRGKCLRAIHDVCACEVIHLVCTHGFSFMCAICIVF